MGTHISLDVLSIPLVRTKDSFSIFRGPFPAEIVRHIFMSLDLPDLLQCALVNKCWNREARAVSANRKCVASIDARNPCNSLKRLDLNLATMITIPFNGLSFHIHGIAHMCQCGANMDDLYVNIIGKLRLKYMKVDWSFICNYSDNCPAVLLLKKMIVSQCANLEELCIEDLPNRGALFEPNSLAGGEICFPKLKVFNFLDDEHPVYFPDNVLRGFIMASPNLEQLGMFVEPEDLGFLTEERFKIVKKLHFGYHSYNHVSFYQKFVKSKPKLIGLCACLQDDLYDNWEIFKTLLESSEQTLEVFGINDTFLEKFLASEMNSFPNVTKLKLSTDEIDTVFVQLLKTLNVSVVFPRTTGVDIDVYYAEAESDSEDHLVHNEEEDEFNIQHGSRISNLRIFGPLKNNALLLLGSVFPVITTLELTALERCFKNFNEIWQCFPKLQQLTLHDVSISRYMNFDAEFCGIHPQEARLLQRRDHKFLKHVHIVPTQPSVTTMKDLRSLRVFFHDISYVAFPYNDYVFLSDVTGHIAFRRLPQLEVTLTCQYGGDIYKLRHLGSFTNLR